jgi:hypothetical protein
VKSTIGNFHTITCLLQRREDTRNTLQKEFVRVN